VGAHRVARHLFVLSGSFQPAMRLRCRVPFQSYLPRSPVPCWPRARCRQPVRRLPSGFCHPYAWRRMHSVHRLPSPQCRAHRLWWVPGVACTHGSAPACCPAAGVPGQQAAAAAGVASAPWARCRPVVGSQRGVPHQGLHQRRQQLRLVQQTSLVCAPCSHLGQQGSRWRLVDQAWRCCNSANVRESWCGRPSHIVS